MSSYRPIRRAELIKGGNIIKQGERFTLGFQFFDEKGSIIVPTKTIAVKIANNSGVIYEATCRVVANIVEFDVTENIGSGVMRVEITVSDGLTLLQKYPADGWLTLKITPSLDDAGIGGINAITVTQLQNSLTKMQNDYKTVVDASIVTIGGKATDALTKSGVAVSTADGAKVKSDATAQQLNNVIIESGTSDAETIQARGTFPILGDRLNSVATQLAEKAKQTVVDSALALKATKIEVTALDTKINSQASGSPKGTYATLAALQTAYPTGNTNIYVVTADGKWYYWNGSVWTSGGVYQGIGIGNATVTPEKTSFLQTELINLYDKTKVTINKQVWADGSIVDGESMYAVTDYMSVKPNVQYRLGGAYGNRAFYDVNKVFIAYESYALGNTTTAPLGAAYIRISIAISQSVVDNFFFKPVIDVVSFNGIKFANNVFDVFPENSITPKKMSFLDFGNLYNKDTITIGNTINDDGTIRDHAPYVLSDYIEVEPSTIYTESNSGNKNFYDVNKNYISTVLWSIGKVFVSPSNAKYIRVTISDNAAIYSAYNLTGGTAVHSFKNIKFTNNVFDIFPNSPNSSNPESKLYGKKWNALGDSITAAVGAYHELIAQKTGVIVRNYGIGGSTVAEGHSFESYPMVTRYSAMNNDADITTVFGGINDTPAISRGDFQLGTMDSTATTTFYGAYKALIEGLIKKYPTKLLATFTPLQADHLAYTLNVDAVSQAIKEVSAKYGVPCLDLTHGGGFSKIPEQLNLVTSDKIHPNALGHKIIAGKIMAFLESLMPIE